MEACSNAVEWILGHGDDVGYHWEWHNASLIILALQKPDQYKVYLFAVESPQELFQSVIII